MDLWKQVKSFENQSTKRIHETNLLKTLRIRDPRYKTNPDLFCKARIEPFWSQDSWPRYKTNPWIRETNPWFYKSLIRFPHPYYFSIATFDDSYLHFWMNDTAHLIVCHVLSSIFYNEFKPRMNVQSNLCYHLSKMAGLSR